MGIRGSTRFQALSGRLIRQLEKHPDESFRPDACKTLRKFAMREAAGFLRINQNTFRQYVSSMSDRIPTGEIDKSNRRYFSLEEIHEIQRILFQAGKIDPKTHPRRQGDEPCAVITFFNPTKGSGVRRT